MPASENHQEPATRATSTRVAELKWLAVLAALLIATVLDGVSIAASSGP